MKAVYTRIDTHTKTSSYRVYNYAPDSATMPYVTFGQPLGARSMFSCRQANVEDNVITVHVWSSYLGDKECSDMMQNIVQAITSADLTLSYYQTPFQCLYDYGEILIDTTEAAKPVRHGILRFRFQMASVS
jgi:hypothetical protein